MSAASSASASGVVLGLVVVFLLQQFGYIALSSVLTSVLYLAIGAIVGGALFGGIAVGLSHRRTTSEAPSSSQQGPARP